MSTISLGADVENLSVKLARGGDYVTGLDSLDGDWPVSAVVTLLFNDSANTAWTATVNGAALDWNVDKAQVDALLDRYATAGVDDSRRKVRLRYVDGTTDLIWAQGKVQLTADWS